MDNNLSFQDDDSSESGDEKDGLEFLLGGLALEDLSPDAWENESHHDDDDDETHQANTNGTRVKVIPTKESAPKRYAVSSFVEGDTDQDPIFRHAYSSSYCTRGGSCTRPSVQVVDLSEFGQGNGLIATVAIPRDQTIFTERAALACQIPQRDEEGGSTGSVELFDVRACQNCFRSLEPAASCQSLTDSPALPMPHLWPIPNFDFDVEDDTATPEELPIRRDKYGRVACKSCQTCFCSEHCRSEQIDQFGSCCTRTRALEALLTMQELDGQQVQSAVALAVCMFGMSLQHYRRTGSRDGTSLHALCGDAKDVTALELGIMEQDSTYSLQPVYNHLLKLFDMTDQEQSVLSSPDLHEMAAQAARNGVGIRTQSPFKTYYTSLVRQAGERGSSKREQLMTDVAKALGSDGGNLERGMDRLVEEKVAPEVVALFPLTARMNHSCAPNAQVRSQEFVDCRMDLVATRDIGPGEEILISYIGGGPSVGRKSRYRRRRELQAKYLFMCECDECQQEISTSSSIAGTPDA